MTSFKGAIAAKTLEEWEDIAIDAIEATGHNPQLLAVAGLGAGMLVAGLAPITALGLIPFLLGMKEAIAVNNKRSRMEAAIESGAYAAVLPMEDLKEYAQQYGTEAAIAQIDWAKRSGVPLSEASEMLLNRYKQKYKALPPVVEPAATPDPQTIGSATQFGAIDTTAVEVEDSPVDQWWDSSPQSGQDDCDRYEWAKDLLNFPAILVWGAQGSGKTSFTSWLLRERLKAGHSAEVWDVHREFGQWNGLPVFGDGMDYDAVNSRMLAFERQVKADYRQRATSPQYSPRRHTVVCEEFTNFARRCEHSAPFFEAALSDLRKVKKGVVFVSHGRTLTAVGGSKGFGKTRDNGLLELELEARIDPQTGDPVPALRGKLKLPGRDAIAVDIATWMNGDMDFSGMAQAATPATTGSNVIEMRSRAIENRNNAPSPPPADTYQDTEDTHTAVSEAGVLADEALQKIGTKISEKFNSSGGDWLTRAAVSRELFNNTDDRNSAKELIDRLISTGQLETEDRANANGSTTTFVRVSRNLSF